MKTNYQINSRYRYEVKNKINGKIEGTGCFTQSTEDLSIQEQISFLHEYTNGMYKNKEQFLGIKIWKLKEGER